MPLESYIVRISRSDAKKPEKVTGQVEFVKNGEKKPFKSIEELIEILSTQQTGSDVRFCVE